MQRAMDLPDLYEATISEIQDGLENGRFKSTHLVKAYLARIEEVNLKGANLHAVSEINPIALRQAEELDAERSEYGSRGPLHGIPILIKDNIATAHELGMNTTAGSYALEGSIVPRDAFVISKLRDAGAILLGKSSMSEWAQWRGEGLPNGFSARGGQTTSPYYPNLDPSASSTGSAIASAIGLAAAALGSETTGSVVLPASRNNVVGTKPTVGLVSRSGVIPISPYQDTVGTLTRCVADAALLLSVIVGDDPDDTCEIGLPPPQEWPDYSKALDAGALRGKRLGVPRALFQSFSVVNDAFQKSLDIFHQLGAHVVDPVDFPSADELIRLKAEERVLTADFKPALNKYLAELVEVPTGVRSLADVIQFNIENADVELPAPYYTDQSQLIVSEASQIDEKHYAALAENWELGRTRGIDAALEAHQLDALILPTDSYATTPTAVAGYPIISGEWSEDWLEALPTRTLHAVPLGHYPHHAQPTPLNPVPLHSCTPNMPFGIAFIGTAYSEYKLISLAYTFEQATKARLQTSAYPSAIPVTQLKDVIPQ